MIISFKKNTILFSVYVMFIYYSGKIIDDIVGPFLVPGK